jgi:hypothetical protein
MILVAILFVMPPLVQQSSESGRILAGIAGIDNRTPREINDDPIDAGNISYIVYFSTCVIILPTRENLLIEVMFREAGRAKSFAEAG